MRATNCTVMRKNAFLYAVRCSANVVFLTCSMVFIEAVWETFADLVPMPSLSDTSFGALLEVCFFLLSSSVSLLDKALLTKIVASKTVRTTFEKAILKSRKFKCLKATSSSRSYPACKVPKTLHAKTLCLLKTKPLSFVWSSWHSISLAHGWLPAETTIGPYRSRM